MLCYQAFAGLLAFVAFQPVTDAAPASQAVPGQAFTVAQVASGSSPNAGHLALQHTFLKHGKAIPSMILYGGAYSNTTAVPEAFDVQYLTPIAIGTPARVLNVVLDTGSSDFWVFADTPGRGNYSPRDSSTATLEQGETFNVAYGDGAGAEGVVYADKVVLGSVTATSQAVEAATSVSAGFAPQLNGILGFGPSDNNQASPNPVSTFFETIRPTLAHPLFATVLRHDAPGSIDIGYVNPDHFSGGILYAPVDFSTGYWTITHSGFAVNYQVHDYSFTSIVDTGTSLIFMPDEVVNAYWAEVESAYYDITQGGWIFACDADLPTFGINIGNGIRTIPGYMFNFSPTNSLGFVPMCYGGLQSSDGLGLNILGDIFLKSVYAVFDFGNGQMGFANQQ